MTAVPILGGLHCEISADMIFGKDRYHKPIIFVTAFPDKLTHRCVEAAGAFALIEKPFDSGELVERLLQALESAEKPAG